MASATYESVRAARTASGQERQRAGSRRDGRTGRQSDPATRRRAGARGFLRGAGASVLIASGYVAVVTALRALLSFG